MKKIAIATALASLLITNVNAELIGFEAGAAYWSADMSGTTKYKGSEIDLEKDLGMGDDNTVFLWADFVHPIPMIPNFKLVKTDLAFSGNSTLTKSITFNNQTYSVSDNVSSDLELNQLDFIFYYRFLNLLSLNTVNLDFGLNVKRIEGTVKLRTSTQSSRNDFTVYIPMAYVKAKFNLPFSGLSLQGDLSYIGYDGSSFYDSKVSVVYSTNIGFGAEAGYRAEKLKIDNIKDTYSDIDVKGFYASIFYHF